MARVGTAACERGRIARHPPRADEDTRAVHPPRHGAAPGSRWTEAASGVTPTRHPIHAVAVAGRGRAGNRPLPGGVRDLLDHIRAEIRFESDRLSGCLNAYIASQSLLLIGYASAMSAAFGRWHSRFTLLFPPALALLGVVLSAQAWPGIRAARAVIGHWHAREEDLFARAPESGAYRSGAPAGRSRQGVPFAVHAPWVFAPAWCHFGTVAVCLYAAG